MAGGRALVAALVGALGVGQPLSADVFPVSGVVISDNVRIRLGPSLGSQIIGKADHGTLLTVLGRSKTATAVTRGGERNWWYDVETADHRRGWMYGAFVYLEAGTDSKKTMSFKIGVNGEQKGFFTRIFASNVYGGSGQRRSLVSLIDKEGKLVFIRLPVNLVDLVRSYRNADQWYVMYSDKNAVQALESVSVMQARNLVTFEVSERAGGTETYRISLTCSYNPDQRWFQVEYSETVPQ